MSLSRKSYQYLIYIFVLIDILIILAGGYTYDANMYALYSFFGLLLIVTTIFLIGMLFKYYNIDLLPTDWHTLIDGYELSNTRFLSTNDHLDPAIDLAKELISRSNQYIYIYTGEYHPDFYRDLKTALESKSAKSDFKLFIASNKEIKDRSILPERSHVLENLTISDCRHFITTDYGFRYELSHICGKKTDAAFAMNLVGAKDVEKDIIDFHIELKNSFEGIVNTRGIT
jgi:hypothetical protein